MGWLTAILNLLGMGGGVSVPVSTIRTVRFTAPSLTTPATISSPSLTGYQVASPTLE